MTNRFSPFVGPDSLRAFNKLNKGLFDVHTKCYEGFVDKRGMKYEGTVENFGSEILIEPRKMLLDKLPLDNMFNKDTMSFYFNIQYSGFVNTYDQQNMLCALLKDNALLSNKTYRIKFNGSDVVVIPRSKSSSDPNVVRDYFYVSTTPPTLIIDEGLEEITLELNGIEGNTRYYLHIGPDTNDIIDAVEEGYVLTKELDNSLCGYALIWMCCDILKTLPDVGLSNNQNNILTIGNNGHDGAGVYPNASNPNIITYGGDALVYPYMNGSIDGDTDVQNWFIKVKSSDNTAFNTNPRSLLNYSADIKEIHLIKYDTIRDVPNETPDVDIRITYNETYSKMMLFTEDISDSIWKFRRPIEGEYDYDGHDYNNLPYAYTELSNFSSNADETVDVLKAAFSIAFDDKYHFKYEEYLINTYTGIHVDNSGYHSDNGIDKKYGVIHSLGDFGGLPSYFKSMSVGNENSHHAHVELYSIRDKQDDVNHKPTEKQTAGIIIDSGIPKITSPEVPEGAYPTIKYVFDTSNIMTYRDIEDESHPPISSRNHLTEMTYAGPGVIGNSNMPEHRNEPKFIYHGNGRFSLTIEDDLDPENEYGRVYIISNDDIKYENNDASTKPKAARTFARICDIPTNFSQISSITGFAPTFVLDEKYVHTDVSFTEYQKGIIWNRTNQSCWLRQSGFNGSVVVSHLVWRVIMDGMYRTLYPEYINLNGQIPLVLSLTDPTAPILLTPNLMGYSDGSVVRFYIGGYAINITYHNDGGVESYDINTNISQNATMPRTNFDSRVSSKTVDLVSGTEPLSPGNVVITINEDVWNNTAKTIVNDGTFNVPIEGGFYFRFDDVNDVFAFEYNLTTHEFEESQRLTGEEIYSNEYDTITSSDIHDSFLYNDITPIDSKMDSYSMIGHLIADDTDIPSDSIIDSRTNYSENLNKSLINNQDSYYIIQESGGPYHEAIYFESCEISHSVNDPYFNLSIPKDTDLNLRSYVNKSNKLRMMEREGYNQPSLLVYDPSCSKKYTRNNSIKIHDMDIITGTEDITYSDKLPNEFISNKHASSNIYKYDEFDTSNTIDAYRKTLSLYGKQKLLDILNSDFSGCNILEFPELFTKEDIVNYIIQNTHKYPIDGSFYTDGDTTVYRKNNIGLFCREGHDLSEKSFTGDMMCITDRRFNSSIKFDNTSGMTTAHPLFFYGLTFTEEEIESIDDPEFSDYRIHNGDGEDISEYCILIINREKYKSVKTDDSGIKWIKFS